MRKLLYILVLGVVALGCADEGIVTEPERVAVRLSGEMFASGAQTREGMINPIAPFDTDSEGNRRGLPPKQLTIGIVSIKLLSTTPSVADWRDDDHSPFIDRGIFGGNKIGDTPESMVADGLAWNGNIEFTNHAGTALQYAFYDLIGDYYHFVCVYPYDDITNHEGYEESSSVGTVLFNIDGSGDIMASNRGYGNNEYPWGGNHATNPEDGVLHFYHKLTALRCKFQAESTTAAQGYGTITSVELIDQPNVVGLNIGQNAEYPLVTPLTDERTTSIPYPAVAEYDLFEEDGVTVVNAAGSVRTQPLTMEVTDAIAFGYVMALPAQEYTFRITTSVHGASNPLYATFDFGSETPKMGTVYNLTFKMMETGKTVVTAAESVEWWLDQTFD
jgi:hypothetical protein